MVMLRNIPPNPIRDIQRAIQSQRKDIMRRDGLRLPRALQHKQLRQDRHALQPDGKGPEDLPEAVFVRQQDGEDARAREEVLHAEGVEGRVVGWLVGVGHEVEDVALGAEEEDLEDGVVDGLCGEEVEVARDVD